MSEDREVCLMGEVVRIEPLAAPNDEPRIGSGDPDAPPAQLYQPALVAAAAWPARAPAGRIGEPADRG